MYKVRKFTDEELKFSQDIREAFEAVEKIINNRLPNARQKSIVLSHIEDAMLHANLAIAETGVIPNEKHEDLEKPHDSFCQTHGCSLETRQSCCGCKDYFDNKQRPKIKTT